jgi:hypothetical protein
MILAPNPRDVLEDVMTPTHDRLPSVTRLSHGDHVRHARCKVACRKLGTKRNGCFFGEVGGAGPLDVRLSSSTFLFAEIAPKVSSATAIVKNVLELKLLTLESWSMHSLSEEM